MNFPRLVSPVILAFLLVAIAPPARAEWTPITLPTSEPLPAGPAGVWLRCFIRVPDPLATLAEKDLNRDSITLNLAQIGGAFSASLNGRKIVESNGIADEVRQRFKVPKGILEKKKFNVLMLALSPEAALAALPAAPILAGYHDELPLDGRWERSDREPAAADFAARSEAPAIAIFTERDFRPATSPLGANAEVIPGAKLPPEESMAKMSTPDDLSVELILHEPLVAQPTHVSFDARGRMWVAQYRQYPYPAGVKMLSRDKYYRAKFDRVPPAPPHHDRGRDIISVHEDTDGDGTFDKHKVVLEGLNMANAALHGHGGFWVMHTPYLLFYPDADGDDVPDRDPEVRLAGFGLEDTHSVANGLAWGPDGWLYGVQGSTTTSRVTRPGIDPADFAGVYHEGVMCWRYQPERKVYEIFADGGGNAFELEFDAEGRAYSGHNGGTTFGWHYVQEGVFLKQGVDVGKFGPPTNPFAFGTLGEMKSRNPIPRFRHATIVAEGTAIPANYLGHFFGADPLHRTVVVGERYRSGSTFETSDSATALSAGDPSARPVYLTNAPDGAIYVADFYEEYIAHGQNYQGQIDVTSGRIYRLRGKNLPLDRDVNLAVKSSAELLATLAHPNRWHRHTAVRLLGERRDRSVLPGLRALAAQPAEHPALEALWALHQMSALEESDALAALEHPEPAVRLWAIRLLGDDRALPERFAARLLDLLTTEPDAEVRCQTASTARRLAMPQSLPLVRALLRRDADAGDPYIPLLCWWTIESHISAAAKNRDSAAATYESIFAAIPWESKLAQDQILARLMRRFAATGLRSDLVVCARLLALAPATEHRQKLLAGFEEAFAGRALPPLPEELLTALAQSGLASPHLRVRLREPAAVAEALRVIADPKAKLEERLLCVRLFGDVKLPECVPALLALIPSKEPADLRKAALTALLLYPDATIGEKVATLYPALSPEVQPAAQTLLTSRGDWTIAFLRLIERGAVPAETVSPAAANALRAHPDTAAAALARKLLTAPVAVTKPAARTEIDRVRKVIASGTGDPYRGEATFLQRCAACHTLFHKGGRIGPDLTPYQREDLGTLLVSVIDPSAEIREGFANTTVTTTDGRTLTGFISDKDGAIVVIRGLDGQDVNVPRNEVRELTAAAASLMPESLLAGLSDQDLRDFFAYLRIPQPISR